MKQSEALKKFFDHANAYLGRTVNLITIRESGKVVPKFDELTGDYEQYSHLFEYWHKLISVEI